MSDVVLSPNMNLPVPIVGQDPGPDWANNINASLGILDQHNHSNGQGVPITPAGININTDLPLNGNNLTLINSLRFNNLSGTLAGSAPNLGVAYEALGNLYFNDSAGNVVQITKSGSVNATSSGISSGSASAAFSGGVLVVDSNTNTPANIQAGSILIGNVVASSNFATLQAPSALGADYSLTLPPTNSTGGTVFLTYDTSNNEGIGPALQNGITRPNLAAVGQQISSSCGSFTTSSNVTAVQVTNLSVTITTSGRPVWIGLQPDGSATPAGLLAGATANTNNEGTIQIFRGGLGGTFLSSLLLPPFSNTTPTDFPLPGFLLLDTPSAGTYTYGIFMQTILASGSLTIGMNNAVLVVYEL
jgi:hypothetical protein